MTASDKKIISLHPTATPYELFEDYGLTKKGYDELIASNNTHLVLPVAPDKPNANLQPQLVPEKVNNLASNLLIPDRVIRHTTQPFLSQVTTHNTVQNGGDVLVLHPSSGKTTPMTRFAAERLIRKHPKDYQIV